MGVRHRLWGVVFRQLIHPPLNLFLGEIVQLDTDDVLHALFRALVTQDGRRGQDRGFAFDVTVYSGANGHFPWGSVFLYGLRFQTSGPVFCLLLCGEGAPYSLPIYQHLNAPVSGRELLRLRQSHKYTS